MEQIKEDIASGRISKPIPVIVLTARNLSADKEREKLFMDFSHADQMIYKPFDMAALVTAIRSLLE